MLHSTFLCVSSAVLLGIQGWVVPSEHPDASIHSTKGELVEPSWRIIPVSKWLVPPQLGDLLSMVLNRLLNGTILQALQ